MKRSLIFEVPARVLAISVVLALVASGTALAQATGNIYVKTLDTEGARLPGVTVTLTGNGAPMSFVTDSNGGARFLGLDPGTHQIKAELDGFASVERPNVVVRIARNTSIEVVMPVAIKEVITVTSESPLLDERKLAAGTTVTQLELEKIPTARDPWAIMTQTPGVVVDRINVGGSESGWPQVFRVQGVSSAQNDFLLDGIQINLMSGGISTNYYDFDQFAEISMTTGGNDATKNTSGLTVNMVTKRGTNEFRGSARFYKAQAKGYFGGALKISGIDVSSEICTTGCNYVQDEDDYVGARINEIAEFGFEAGGPAWRDKVWLWGSWGQNNIRTFASSGDPDDTFLENTAIKVNAQFTAANSFVASYNNGDKTKAGRGAGPTRAPETLWDQRAPSAISRFEDTHVFSSDFFLTGTYSIVDFGFAIMARGPADVANGLDPAAPDPTFGSDGVWRDNYISGRSSRPSDEYRLDGSYFFNTGNTSHELKVGGRFRTVERTEVFSWGPRNVHHTFWGTTLARHSQTGPSTNEYASLWAQDTMTFGKFTINVGLRYDNQSGSNDAATFEPHAVFPDALPGLDVPAGVSDLTWSTVTPRVGVTYALGEERKTLLRGSFSRYADQLTVGLANWTSPTYYGWYAYFYGGEMYTAFYFDPLNPSVSPNKFGSNFDPPITSELIIGAEHSILPEFVVAASLTYRKIEDISDLRQIVRDGSGGLRAATASDYTVISNPTGNIPRSGGETYSVDFIDLIGQPGVLETIDGAPSGGAMWLTGPREREYFGGTVSFTKRLANNWMARGFVNYGDAEWSVPASGFIDCPTGFANNGRGGGCRDGDLYVERSHGGGKGERFLQSTWSFNLNGMYQIAPDRRWGFNVSANINGPPGVSESPTTIGARAPMEA